MCIRDRVKTGYKEIYGVNCKNNDINKRVYMKIHIFFLLLVGLNLQSENSISALEDTIEKFWEARNDQDFEKIFFYESKIGALTGSSAENHFYEDPPPDLKSVIDYYSKVESNVKPYNITIRKLSDNVYLSLYYLVGSYKYSSGKINNDYKTRVSNIWLFEDGGFKLYYKNFTNLKKELEPTKIIAYPMD